MGILSLEEALPKRDGESQLLENTTVQRRNLVLAAAVFAEGAARAQPHAGAHHTLPVAPSSPSYAKLQGGVTHHMTPEQRRVSALRTALRRPGRAGAGWRGPRCLFRVAAKSGRLKRA